MEKKRKKRLPSVEKKTVVLQPTALVLATFLLLLLSKWIDVTLLDRDNEYLSVVILQMMIFLIPAAIWCRLGGERYLRGLRLRIMPADSVALILAASVLMISGGVLVSILFGGLESLSESFSLYDTFISKDDGSAPIKLYLIMAYAVLPALCEEFVYRGILCHEYEKGGVLRAILLSSLFFSLLHFNLPNFPVYFFSGVVLAMTLYATRSIWGAVLAHFLYNLFGLFGQPYVSTFYNITGSTALFVFVVGFLFLVCGTVFCGEAARLYKKYLYRSYSADYRKPKNEGWEAVRDAYLEVFSAPSAIACLAVYILALIVGWL